MVVLFLGRYVPMVGIIDMCVDCFLCVVSCDPVLLASISNRKLLANLSNLETQNGPSTHVIVATSFVIRQIGKSCRGGAAVVGIIFSLLSRPKLVKKLQFYKAQKNSGHRYAPLVVKLLIKVNL